MEIYPIKKQTKPQAGSSVLIMPSKKYFPYSLIKASSRNSDDGTVSIISHSSSSGIMKQ